MCTSEGSPPPHEYRFYFKAAHNYLGNSSSGFFQTQVTESGFYFCAPINKVGFGDKDGLIITVVGIVLYIYICQFFLFYTLDQSFIEIGGDLQKRKR